MFNSEDNDAFILVVLLYSNAHRLGIVNSINLVCCAFCNKLLLFSIQVFQVSCNSHTSQR